MSSHIKKENPFPLEQNNFKPCLFKSQGKAKPCVGQTKTRFQTQKVGEEKVRRRKGKEGEKFKQRKKERKQQELVSKEDLTNFLPGVSPKAATMAKY